MPDFLSFLDCFTTQKILNCKDLTFTFFLIWASKGKYPGYNMGQFKQINIKVSLLWCIHKELKDI